MSISSYQNSDGVVLWKVYVNMRSKLNHSIRAQRAVAGIKSEKEALKEEISLIRKCERELLEKEALGSSWNAVVDAWESHIKDSGLRLAETTKMDYVAAVRNYTEEWKKRAASSITKLNVRELLHSMKNQGCSFGFQKRMKGLLNQVFVFGIDNQLIRGIDRSPTFGVQLDKQEQKKPEILTAGEIRKLLSEARTYQHPWYPVWAMALLTGMRSGELYALLWSDINWETKTITVNKSYNGRMHCIKSTKSGDWRSVPISSELEALLKELKPQTELSSYVLPRFPTWRDGYQAQELRKFCLGIKSPLHSVSCAQSLLCNAIDPEWCSGHHDSKDLWLEGS